MKNLFLISLFCCLLFCALAQNPSSDKSLRAVIERIDVSGDANKRFAGTKYSLLFTKNFSTSRWSLESGLGYINYYSREQFSPYNYYFNGDQSQRILADFAALYDLIRGNRFSFRIGAGPSVWYQRNGAVRDLSGLFNGQQLDRVYFIRAYKSEFNIGVNLRSDFEYQIAPRVILGARAGVIGNLLSSDAEGSLIGTLTAVGLSIGYSF